MQNAVKTFGLAGIVMTQQRPALAGEATGDIIEPRFSQFENRTNEKSVQGDQDIIRHLLNHSHVAFLHCLVALPQSAVVTDRPTAALVSFTQLATLQSMHALQPSIIAHAQTRQNFFEDGLNGLTGTPPVIASGWGAYTIYQIIWQTAFRPRPRPANNSRTPSVVGVSCRIS